MKKLLLTTALSLMICLLPSANLHATSEGSRPTFMDQLMTTIIESSEHISAKSIGNQRIELSESGGHKFGGRKAQNKRNRRTKRINRKNGIGMLPVVIWKEVNCG